MSQNSNSIGLNELVDYQKKTYTPMMDRIMKFLWNCAGADPQILQYSPYSDHIKNAGIGGVVLATTVMAGLAMGFAMHTIFGENDDKGGHHGNWAVTIPVAIVWALIIFNLDRFIVSTVKGDGTEKITKGEFWAMLPRLLMAIIIGLTISAPLETHIFEKEIRREWDKVTAKMALNEQNGVELDYERMQTRYDSLISEAERKWKDAVSNYKDREMEVDNLEKGIGYSQPCIQGPTCSLGAHRDKYKKRDVAKLDADNAKAELDRIIIQRNSAEESKQQKIASTRSRIEKLPPGFLDQLMMLEKLSYEGEKFTPVDPITKKPKTDENGKPVEEVLYSSAWGPIWLIRFLFMIVEIAPVIFKFMIWKSSYDYMQDNVAQILEAKQGISLEIITDENNNMHKVKENYNARRIVEVSKRQNELEKENAIHAITLFAEKEREAIEKDPGKFIRHATEGTTAEIPGSSPGEGSTSGEEITSAGESSPPPPPVEPEQPKSNSGGDTQNP